MRSMMTSASQPGCSIAFRRIVLKERDERPKASTRKNIPWLILQWYFNLTLVREPQKFNGLCCTGKIPTHRNFNGLRESTTVVLMHVQEI
jgi:hypothetical protein